MNPQPHIDLQAIVPTVHASQRQGCGGKPMSAGMIYVDRNGGFIPSRNPGVSQPENHSRIQPETFHAGWDVAEHRIARTRMPENTREIVTNEGIRGWLFSFQTEYLDTYTMFSYFDGSFYQVMVVSPAVEDRFRSPHTGHLFSDGRICMGAGMSSGRRTLADAYAKSVLWANGFSAMIHGKLDKFPFNHND